MTIYHLKMGVEPPPKVLHVSNILQTMNNVQHIIHIMNELVSQVIFTSSYQKLNSKSIQ